MAAMQQFKGGISHIGASLLASLLQFRNQYSVLTIGVLATVFTWGFIQGTKKFFLTPFIRRYVLNDRDVEDLLNIIRPEAWYAEAIEYVLLMSILVVFWMMFVKKQELNDDLNVGFDSRKNSKNK